MAELKIPEKWRDVYRQCNEFLAHPGEPSTKPIEWCVSLIEECAMLKAQVKRLEDSRFALAVAHTEDVLTIERLTAKEKSWRRDGSDAPEESKTAQHPPA